MTIQADPDADLYASRPGCRRQDCNLRYACEDCRPDEWRDVEYYEDWLAIGASPQDAIDWDMDIVFAEVWMEADFDASEAHAFYELDFDVEEAEWWRTRQVDGWTLVDAVDHLNCCDVTPEMALARLRSWVEAGRPLDHRTIAYVRAGIDVAEADKFDNEALQLQTALVSCWH